MRIPTLTRPRFRLADIAAKSVLKELGNPDPPIPVESFIKSRKWKVKFDELYGPDGYMAKLTRGLKTKFIIYLASDIDPNGAFDVEQRKRRQYFTLAHELGHILLHGGYLLNSHDDMDLIPEDVAGILEVEAHWFASRLLMPNYVFKKVSDLLPDQLADKCGVNLTAASKRIKSLTPNIRNSLIKSARLDEWPPLEVFDFPSPPKEARYQSWAAYEESAASSEPIIEKNEKPNTEVLIPTHKIDKSISEYNAKMIDRFRRMYGFE